MKYGATKQNVKEHFEAHPRGLVFGVAAFATFGSPDAVESALRSLVKESAILRASRGKYTLPVVSRVTGKPLSASESAIVSAYVGLHVIQVTGAAAANRLGLTNQVPMVSSFLSPSRHRPVLLKSGRQIRFVAVGPKRFAVAGRVSGDVFEALRWLGKREASSKKTIETVRGNLSVSDRKTLTADIVMAPEWMRAIVSKIIA